jgi:NAD(P)-dependent dehydrogenase (short-subunit alcohol dehydrogenase family)
MTPTSPGALVVTGGGRGIGARIAVQAARGGAPVALVYRSRPDNAARVVAEIQAAGGRAMAIAADVGSEADVARTFEAVDATFGPVGGLVNNAVMAGPPRRLAELPADELEAVFRTNVLGAFFCCREATRRLSTKNGGDGAGSFWSPRRMQLTREPQGTGCTSRQARHHSRRCRGGSPGSLPRRASASMSCGPASSPPSHA